MNARRTYLWGAAAVAAEALGYLAWRPRMLRWGATEEEAAEPLPGDEITPHPRVRSTRAITIEAPPEEVWPWIVQMGMGRAGFYTHEWVERPLACVVPRPGEPPRAEELRAFLAPRIARWWNPESFAFVAEIPKTSVGKLDKKRLRDALARGELAVVTVETSH